MGALVLLPIVVFSTLLTGCPAKSNPASPSSSATSVVYLYESDTTAAGNFQTLLDANGYSVTEVAMTDAGSLNFNSYGVIVISTDSASNSPWGTTAVVNAIKSSNKPVLGLGAGGAYFFDTAGDSSIGWNHAAGTAGISVEAVTPSSSIWSSPNAISTSGAVTIYSTTSSGEEEQYTAPGSGTTLVAYNPSDTSYYPLASYTSGGTTYFYWGFYSDPSTMSTTGKNLFINVMKSL